MIASCLNVFHCDFLAITESMLSKHLSVPFDLGTKVFKAPRYFGERAACRAWWEVLETSQHHYPESRPKGVRVGLVPLPFSSNRLNAFQTFSLISLQFFDFPQQKTLQFIRFLLLFKERLRRFWWSASQKASRNLSSGVILITFRNWRILETHINLT